MKSVINGNLEARLATKEDEKIKAQELRYKVFYEEQNAGKPTEEIARLKRDFDKYDEHCDHLIIIDHSLPKDNIIGTYRLIRRHAANKVGSFYTEGEFDITNLKNFQGEILELGRACITKEYRNNITLKMLWNAIALYMFENDITLMFGCADFLGKDPKEFALPLSYLYHYHRSPKELKVNGIGNNQISMNLMDKEDIDIRQALKEMPALIKGYLRVGAYISHTAFLDEVDFECIDVCIIFDTSKLDKKYLRNVSRLKED